MSKNYDMIATVDIDIATPIVDDTSFDNLLIVGPLPAIAPVKEPPEVGVYNTLDEVVEAGGVAIGDDADPVGMAAAAAFGQSPRPTAVYIAPTKSGEKAINAIARAIPVSGWYVVCTAGIEDTEYEEIAQFIETQEKMFCYTELNFFENANRPTVGTVYFRTIGIYGGTKTGQDDSEIPPMNRYINAAWVAKWLNYPSGSETAAFKKLASVYPAELTSTEMKSLKDKNLNFFITVGNRNITMNGITVGGEWCDVIRFRDWLKNDMQVRVVNLFVVTPKIPYTDNGIALVHNQMIASLKAGQAAGGIAPDEYDEDHNLIPAFVTSVPLAASLSASERASRKLTKCKFTARLAGAIHFAEIKGTLAYEL